MKKVLLYWHDMALPHSQYLFHAFDRLEGVSAVRIIGPKGRKTAASIYTVNAKQDYAWQKTEFVPVETSKVRETVCLKQEWVRQIREFRPDIIIVLDEALSVNVLRAAEVNRACNGGKARVYFYGFENLVQGWGWQGFVARPGLGTLKRMLRKTLRLVLLDHMMMGRRRKLITGGLVSYPECADIVRAYHWNPPMVQQWWGVNEKAFSGQGPVLRPDLPCQHIVGFVGRFIPEKGIDDLIRAMAQLDDSYGLALIGGGAEQPKLEKLVAELGLQQRVAFVPPQNQQNLAAYYRGLDVVALPSRTIETWKEQYGRVLIEAMLCGTPVVGSDSGAIPHVIGVPECVFHEGDVGEIAACLRWVSDPAHHDAFLPVVARLRSATTSDAFAKAWLDLDQDILARQG